MNRTFWRRIAALLILTLLVAGGVQVSVATAAQMNPLALLPGPLIGTYGLERPLVTGGNVSSPSVYGHLIAYTDYVSDGDIRLYNMKTNATYPVSVHAGSVQTSPRIWGNRIVWQDNRNGNWDIYWYDIAKKTEHRLTTQSTAEQMPAIDGDRVVWSDARNGNLDIYMYDFKTKVTTRITTNSASQTQPDISGNRIVWHENRNGNLDIYWYDIAKKQEYQLTSGPQDEYQAHVWGSRASWTLYNGVDPDMVVAFYFDANGAQIVTAGGAGSQDGGTIYKDTILWQDNIKTRIYRFGGQGTQLLTTSAGHKSGARMWGDTVFWADARPGMTYDLYAMDIPSPSLTISAPTVVGYGARTKVTGYLKSWDGKPLSNRQVQVQYVLEKDIRSTENWPLVDTDAATPGTQLPKTNSLGQFTAYVPAQATRFFVRAHFAGDPDAYWQTSSQRTVVPKVSLSKPVGNSTVANTKSYTYYGYLKPKHTAGTQRVWIKCYRKVSGTYVLKKTYTANLSDYSTYTKYSKQITLGTEGSWRIRAYYKSTLNNAETYSSYKYVTSN